VRLFGRIAVFVGLFWFLLLAAVIVLWKVANGPVQKLSYAEFTEQVDKHRVSSATFFTSQSPSEIAGQLRSPPGLYKVTVAKEAIPDVMERLRNQIFEVQVSLGAPVSWPRFLLDVSPVFVIIGLWVYVVMRKRSKASPGLPG
jgi:ATP-dependent Zn protease